MSHHQETGKIVRAIHDSTHNYVKISNAVVRDAHLSWAARGLLCYLLSHTDDWHVRLYDLVNNSPAGETHVRSLLKELEKAGYLTRRRVRLKDGRFEWQNTVYEQPQAIVAKDDRTTSKTATCGPAGDGLPTVGAPMVGGPQDIRSTDSRITESQRTDLTPHSTSQPGRRGQMAEECQSNTVWSAAMAYLGSESEARRFLRAINDCIEKWGEQSVLDAISKARLAGGHAWAYVAKCCQTADSQARAEAAEKPKPRAPRTVELVSELTGRRETVTLG